MASRAFTKWVSGPSDASYWIRSGLFAETDGIQCRGLVSVSPPMLQARKYSSFFVRAEPEVMAQCPVDHPPTSSPSSCSSASSQVQTPNSDTCPVDHSSFVHSPEADKCPVDHDTRSMWSRLFPSNASTNANVNVGVGTSAPNLSTLREISSIPRADTTEGEKWVYPSEVQFFAAMARKQQLHGRSPRAEDMRVVVPIHNAVNERAWGEVLGWETGRGGERCGGVKLVSFKGRPKDRTPKAWMKTLLGYQAPFDRHDWVVDRCGTRMRYVIDFYSGRSSQAGNLSFYLDVRPALDNWEGVKMRAVRFFERWMPRTSAAANDAGPAKQTGR